MKKILAGCLFLFILSAGSVLAVAMPAVSLPTTSSTTLGTVKNMNPLTAVRSVVGVPMTFGNYIVWEDIRNNSTTGHDIYGMDKTTGIEFSICTATGNQTAPFIDGNIVVWSDSRNPLRQDIFAYNLVTKEIQEGDMVLYDPHYNIEPEFTTHQQLGRMYFRIQRKNISAIIKQQK